MAYAKKSGGKSKGKAVKKSHKGGKSNYKPKSAVYAKKSYKKRSTNYTKTVKDGAGDQQIVMAHGKPVPKLNRRLEMQIRDALTAVSTMTMQNAFVMTPAINQCVYNSSSSTSLSPNELCEIGSVYDIDAIMSSDASEGLQNGYGGRLHIKSMRQEISITNMTSGLMHVRVYEYIHRHDLPNARHSMPYVIYQGFDDNDDATGITRTSLASKLYANPLFCVYAKITKDSLLELPQGRTITLVQTNNKEYVVNPLVWNDADNVSIAGITRGIALQCYGSSCVDSSAHTVAGISSGDLAVTRLAKYTFSVVGHATQGTYANSALTAFTGSDYVFNVATGGLANLVKP